MKKHFRILALIVLATTFFSCRGDNGLDGKDGEDGVNGQAGANGNANIIISTWKDFSLQKDIIFNGSSMKVATVLAPALTLPMVDNAGIFVYINFGGGVYPLPYTSAAGGKVNSINFFPQKKKIGPTRFTHDYSNEIC